MIMIILFVILQVNWDNQRNSVKKLKRSYRQWFLN